MRRLHFHILIFLLGGVIAGRAAHAIPWSHGSSSGVTRVSSTLDDATHTFTWVLQNATGTSDSPIGSGQALVWSLQPFSLYAPTAWTAPPGWTWDRSVGAWQNYEIANQNRKYYTPPSIGPGASATFTYTFDPNGPIINTFDKGFTGDPFTIGFLAYVAAVAPGSGTPDGSAKWSQTTDPVYGTMWYDRSDYRLDLIPEPSSLLALGMGAAGLAGFIRRRMWKSNR